MNLFKKKLNGKLPGEKKLDDAAEKLAAAVERVKQVKADSPGGAEASFIHLVSALGPK